MLKKQGRKVLRGPRSIPNLRSHAGSRSTSGSGAGRPALPALGGAFQEHTTAAEDSTTSPDSSFSGGNSTVGGGGLVSTAQPPQIALTQYGGDFASETTALTNRAGLGWPGSTLLSASPATRAAALTEGDVWGALLGTNDDAATASPGQRRQGGDDLGLGLDLHHSGGIAETGESPSAEGPTSSQENAESTVSSTAANPSLLSVQARRRRRLEALSATRAGVEVGSYLEPSAGLTPSVKFQTVSCRKGGPLARAVSVSRASLRSIAPFGPAVVVQQPILRKTASSGLQLPGQRQGAAVLGPEPPASAPPVPTEGRGIHLFPGQGTAATSPELSDSATPNVAGSQTPRIQPQLRQQPSFTSSTGSHRTARGTGSEAHTLHLGGEGGTDLQGLGEDAEQVLQYPEEPLSHGASPIITSSTLPAPAAEDSYPRAFLPYLKHTKLDDPTLIFDIFQAYAQVDTEEGTDAKRLSLTSVPTGSTSVMGSAEGHKRNESVDSLSQPAGKTVPASPSISTVQSSESSSSSHASPGMDRSSRHLSTSSTQSSAGGGSGAAGAMPTDDPRFAIWTMRGAEQPAVVAIGADAFTTFTGDGAEPVASPKPPTANPTSRFSIRPPATPETPGRDRAARAQFAQPSPFGPAGDAFDAVTPTAGTNEPRRKQARNSQLREDGLLPLDKPTLLAATKSRMVAELTAEIDSRLLTDFFFTYRLFMTPCELFRLLSLRFQWALGEPTSPHDEARRRIVRVRTYTVLKYWLSNLFEYDFLSDGALRSELTKWLNSLAKDPALADRAQDLAIVKSLKKKVRELKEQYSRAGVGGLLAGDPGIMATSENAEAPSLLVSAPTPAIGEPEPSSQPIKSPKLQDDVDLTLGPDDKQQQALPEEPADVQDSAPPSRVTSLTRGNRARSGSDSLAPSWLEQRRASQQEEDRSAPSGAQPFLTAPFGLFDETAQVSGFPPQGGDFAGAPAESVAEERAVMVMQPTHSPQNPLSKAFSNTVTRLTRFGRALGNRSTLTVPFSGESNAAQTDQEAVELVDLLADPRQLQSFIEALRVAQEAAAAATVADKPKLEPTVEVAEPSSSNRTSFQGLAAPESVSSQSDGTNLDNTPGLSDASQSTPASSVRHRDSMSGESPPDSRRNSSSGLGLGLGIDSDSKPVEDSVASLPPMVSPAPNEVLHRYTSNQTLRTLDSGTENAHTTTVGLAPAPTFRELSAYNDDSLEGPNVVQIDDIDLSSDEDDGVVRRALRRLPGARDLRTTNNVRDLGGDEPRTSLDSFSMASGHGPVRAAYSSIPASIAMSQRSGSWQQPRRESGSSIGMSLGNGLAVPTYPDKITTVTTELLDPDEALAGYELVKGFRLDDVESDDEEPGDVEAALRRLEGLIDEEKQREKARRVDRMFAESQARIAQRERASKRATVAILGEEEGPRDSVVSKAPSSLGRISDSRERETDVEGGVRISDEDEGVRASSSVDEPTSPLSEDAEADSAKVKIRTYAEQRSPFLRARLPLGSPKGGRPPLPSGAAARAARPITFGAVPGADLVRPAGRTTRQGRVLMSANNPSGANSTSPSGGNSNTAIVPSPRPPLHLPVMHHSFLLNSAPETIAQQFTLIEAELFKAVNWDELVTGRWKERTLEALAWETFYQRTGRRKAECIASGRPYKERAVDAIIARFNLMCGWVASEVVLTQSIEMRAKLLSKLIRIAWKCYEQHNHATLTQILVGLQFPAVERLHKTWARLPAKQRRIFRDLKTFTSPSRNFAYLRGELQAKVTELKMAELMMMTTGMSSSTTRNPFSLAPFASQPGGAGAETGGGAGKSKRADHVVEGFVPFFGLFTSTLDAAEMLPTFIDPSAPSTPVNMDPVTGELRSLANPSAFDHLPALPPTIKLEPLLNMFKSRALALTVKTIIAFQERAALYSFEADRNLYVKCLKVRTLQGHQLTSLSSFVEP